MRPLFSRFPPDRTFRGQAKAPASTDQPSKGCIQAGPVVRQLRTFTIYNCLLWSGLEALIPKLSGQFASNFCLLRHLQNIKFGSSRPCDWWRAMPLVNPLIVQFQRTVALLLIIGSVRTAWTRCNISCQAVTFIFDVTIPVVAWRYSNEFKVP